MTTTVTVKGQVTLPKEVREKAGIKPGDKVEVRETHRSRGPFKEVADLIVSREIPDWLNVDATKLAGSVVNAPRRDQMPLDLNEQLVVEYYSR